MRVQLDCSALPRCRGDLGARRRLNEVNGESGGWASNRRVSAPLPSFRPHASSHTPAIGCPGLPRTQSPSRQWRRQAAPVNVTPRSRRTRAPEFDISTSPDLRHLDQQRSRVQVDTDDKVPEARSPLADLFVTPSNRPRCSGRGDSSIYPVAYILF